MATLRGLKHSAAFNLDVSVKKSSPYSHCESMQPGSYRLSVHSSLPTAGTGKHVINVKIKVNNETEEFSLRGTKPAKHFFDLNEPAKVSVEITAKSLLMSLPVIVRLSTAAPLDDTCDEVHDFDKLGFKDISVRQRLDAEEKVLSKWPPPSGQVFGFDYSRCIAEMKRESKAKSQALKDGYIRAFLLLVGMHPATRVFWAASLDIDLITRPFFGDSHAEAAYIIDGPNGLKQRTAGFIETLTGIVGTVIDQKDQSCWYETVQRVATNLFVSRGAFFSKNEAVDKEHRARIKNAHISSNSAQKESTIPTARKMHDLEQLYLRCLAIKISGALGSDLSEEQRRVVHAQGQHHIDYLRSIGWNDDKVNYLLLRNALHSDDEFTLFNVDQWIRKKKESKTFGKVKMATPAVMLMVSPIPVIPLFMLSKAVIEYHFKCGTHGTMAAMVTALLTYRFRLEVNSFTLDQFYPKE